MKKPPMTGASFAKQTREVGPVRFQRLHLLLGGRERLSQRLGLLLAGLGILTCPALNAVALLSVLLASPVDLGQLEEELHQLHGQLVVRRRAQQDAGVSSVQRNGIEVARPAVHLLRAGAVAVGVDGPRHLGGGATDG